MNSAYISSKPRLKRVSSKAISLILTSFLALIVILGGIGAANIHKEEASAGDPVKYIMCMFDEKSIPREMYQATQTSDLNFEFESKSSITSGQEDVAIGPVGLNWILGLFMDFKETNEVIIGQSLDGFEGSSVEGEDTATPPATPPEDEESEEPEFNGGDTVTPFDRFGVAGLTWTSYSGEWKYVQVDACAVEGAEPKDPKAGMYYEERLEPRSTYEDIPKTKDVRTSQFAKGMAAHYVNAFINLLANAVFFLTKLIVVLTVAFVQFAFSDIVHIFGLNDMLAGGSNGIFTVLYNGLFTPLILLVFFLTAAWVFWNGIVKRQGRTALTGLLRSIVLFIIAVVIATAPTFFIALPNQIALVVQAIVVNTMSTGISGGNGICVVGGAQETEQIGGTSVDDENLLDNATTSMRSAIGCQMWNAFLLKPWSEGQFGVDWSQVWAKDKTAEWVNDSATGELTNTNESVVGDAAVPMGGEEFMNNWALYQISTQTNAHSPTNHEGERSKYTSGVANDWWRIVDATSNYNEKTTTVNNDFLGTAASNGWGDQYVEVSVEEPDEAALPTEQWDSWVGNSPWNRMGIAFTSIVAAGVGLAAPLVFAFLSAVYALGIAILMAFAPIMLLLGCWAGRGWEMFKGWGELVLDTLMKRIVAGLLMVLSVIIMSTILNLMDDAGYWWGIIALIIVSVVLIQSREKIMSSAAAIFTFKFSNVDFSSSAKTFYQQTAVRAGNMMTDSTKMGGGIAAGAIGAKAAGGSAVDGMKKGAMQELKNRSYRSKALRPVMTSYEAFKTQKEPDVKLSGHEFCAVCGAELKYEDSQDGTGMFIGGRDADGNLICRECFESGEGGEGAYEYIARNDPNEEATLADRVNGSTLAEKERGNETEARRFKSWMDNDGEGGGEKLQQYSSAKFKGNMEELTREASSGPNSLGNIVGNSVQLDKESYLKNGEQAAIPAIPEKLRPFLEGNETAIAEMWKQGKYELILYMYSVAALEWFYSENEDLEPGELFSSANMPSEEASLIHAQAVETYNITKQK